jgi:Flp pilus assembly protein TadD
LARIYLTKNDDVQLAPILAELAAKDADNANMRKKLAQLAIAAKDPAAGLRWATEAMHLNLRDATAHALRGAAALSLDKHDLAERELQLAVKLDGSQPEWRANLIRTLLKAKKLAEAKASLSELEKTTPDFAELDELRQAIKDQQP